MLQSLVCFLFLFLFFFFAAAVLVSLVRRDWCTSIASDWEYGQSSWIVIDFFWAHPCCNQATMCCQTSKTVETASVDAQCISIIIINTFFGFCLWYTWRETCEVIALVCPYGQWNPFFTGSVSQTYVKLLSVNNLLLFPPQWFHLSEHSVRWLGHRLTSPPLCPLTWTSIFCPNSLMWNIT